MDMTRLMGYGIPDRLIERWRACQGDRLLPLQERAVTDFDLFGPDNLLVQAPTSAGKTFIGEMAAVESAVRRGKAVYLVPLRALAAEKYAEFQERYEPLGLKVIVSSREHRAHDADFERGDFSLAVAVYEKFAQLLAARPERLNEIRVVVADEMELLADPERGATVELLLARLRLAGCRIIGLSAVLGDADRVADWLNARCVTHERRPVELRYGVLHDGVYRYRTHNDHAEGEEPMVNAHSPSSWEQLSQNVRWLAENGENCLIFVKAKHEARRGAELLAARLRLPAASEALEELRYMEPTRARDTLLRTLSNGVAFHNTDLTQEERRIAETAFRTGAARVMISTSTLAVGLNLPAANVFLSADKWIYDPRFDLPWKVPIDQGEYENMSGRAGRYGAGQAYGRSILVAATPFDLDSMWRCYVQGRRAPIQPPLAQAPLEDHVLRLLAARGCRTAAELTEFFDQTLTARLAWQGHLPGETAFRVRAAVHQCLEAGVLRPWDGDGWTAGAEADQADAPALDPTAPPPPNTPLEVTPFGRAAAAKGISIATALEIRRWIRLSIHRHWQDIDLVLALALTPDGRMRQVSLSAREYEQAGYPGRLKQVAASQEMQADTPLNRFRIARIMPFFDEVRSIKAALFLHDWMDQAPLPALEERYETTAGQVLGAADQIAWLADATAAIADAIDAPQALSDAIAQAGARCAHGVRTDVMLLIQAAGGRLDRAAAMRLHEAGMHTPQALRAAPAAALERFVPGEVAVLLKNWAEAVLADTPQGLCAAPCPPPPVLMVDDRHPDRVTVQGIPVPLQDRQFRLMRTLAAKPGECVPYEKIYQAIWGKTVVEDGQLHYQKSMLLRRVAQAVPGFADGLIKSIPRQGFVLTLDPEQVHCFRSAATSAA